MKFTDTKDIYFFNIQPGRSETVLAIDDVMAVDGVLLGVCYRGTFTYQTNHINRQVVAGYGVLLLPGQLFSVKSASDDLWVSAVYLKSQLLDELLSLGGSLLTTNSGEMILQLLKDVKQKDYLTASDVELSREQFDDIAKLFSVLANHIPPKIEIPDKDVAIQLFSSIMLLLSRQMKAGNIGLRKMVRSEQITQDFFMLVFQHHTTEHNLAFYASKLSVCPKYLSHVVRSTTGSSAQTWLNQVLLYSAKTLLRKSSLSINEIADKLSFSSAGSFIRFFHRLTGTTPRGYRGGL